MTSQPPPPPETAAPQRSRQVYTPSQITAFLTHIGLPARFRDSSPLVPSLPLLCALHTHVLSALPYENLAIHYSPSHRVSLDPQVLFAKTVTRGAGRGGYCMENALLYYHVLKGLGFDVYTVGARTRERDSGGVPGGEFPGWVHIVNIVTLPTATTTSADGTVLQKYQRYHVDIAFGGDGALFPMPLTPGLVHANLGTQQIRLVKEYISTQTHRPDHHDGGDPDRHKLWVYQYRNSPQAEWNSYYCFAETEFMQMDWEVVNWWTSTSERSLQTHRPLCILFLRRPNRGTNGAQQEQARGEDVDGVGDAAGDNSSADTGDFHIYGKRMLVAGVVKENLGGKTRILATCETEVQRVAALKEYFDITLTDEEIGGIRGFRSELMQHDPAS